MRALPPSARWSAYALAALLALAAAAWVSDGRDSLDVVQPAARTSAATAAGAAVPIGNERTEARAATGLAQPAPRQAEAAGSDPFAVVGAAPDKAAASRVVAPVAVSVRRAPSAPALPFVYLGRWQERGKTLVFLQREDRAYKVDGPGPLDAEYAVQSIDDNRITFNYLPLGVVQELRLDVSAPPAGPALGAAPARGSTPEPDQGEN